MGLKPRVSAGQTGTAARSQVRGVGGPGLISELSLSRQIVVGFAYFPGEGENF